MACQTHERLWLGKPWILSIIPVSIKKDGINQSSSLGAFRVGGGGGSINLFMWLFALKFGTFGDK